MPAGRKKRGVDALELGMESRVGHPPKTLVSCDACRARKVKCDRPEQTADGEEASCSHCVGLGVNCLVSHRPKRRGPPNQYLLRLQSNDGTAAAAACVKDPTIPPPPEQSTHSAEHLDLGAFSPPYGASTRGRYPAYPHNPNNILDNLLPRGLLYAIIDNYFDYVYPLEPLVHRPTFMRDLHMQREERAGQDEWVALVLSIVGTTVCRLQALKDLLSRDDAQILTQKCYHLIRGYLSRDHDYLSLERSVIMSFFGIICASVGRDMLSIATRGALVAMMSRQGLYLESTYQRLPVLERELRRRVFWLMYGGDVTLGTVEGLPPLMNEDECSSVGLPAAIDDEYLSEEAYLESNDDVSLLHGLVYVSRLFRLLGQVLELRRRDQRHPPTTAAVNLRLLELDELGEQINNVMIDCPSALRMDLSSPPSPFGDFLNDIRAMLGTSQPPNLVRNAFLVQQANIYVTQQLARFVVFSYRADLAQLTDTPIIDTRSSGLAFVSKSFSREQKNEIASDLLSILKKIPTHLIAINTRSLIKKIRFVACTLLEVDSDALGSSFDQLTERADLAQRNLLEFLSILGELEAMSQMDPVPL